MFCNQSLLDNLDGITTDCTKINILNLKCPMIVHVHMYRPLLLWGFVVLLITLDMDRVGSGVGMGVQLIGRVRGDDGRMLD